MKNMKKIFSPVIIICIAATACDKEFLEKSPIVGVTEENFYKTEADAIAAVNAAYAAMQFQLSPEGHFRWFWGDIMSDDAVKGGGNDNDVYSLLLLETFKGPVNTELLEAEWGADYEAVYRANVVLERVPPIVMDVVEGKDTWRSEIYPCMEFLQSRGDVWRCPSG
jgi:starch-binding outer membrane protein, SusD/RagB family